MCREAGGRVSTNVFLRDKALDTVQADGRRLEVVVDGLPLIRGAQLAIDTTLGHRCEATASRTGDVLTWTAQPSGDVRSAPTPSCAKATAEQDWSMVGRGRRLP